MMLKLCWWGVGVLLWCGCWWMFCGLVCYVGFGVVVGLLFCLKMGDVGWFGWVVLFWIFIVVFLYCVCLCLV